MPEIFDLHCHSTASDGALTPDALLRRAGEKGVTSLALTDHDSTAGLAVARQTADAIGIDLIPGIEISTTWNNKCFHIIGLNIDANYPPLLEGMRELRVTRNRRAEKIAAKLEKAGIPNVLPAVLEQAGEGMITRTHFAAFLLRENHVSTLQEAFDRYLGKGKPAFAATTWVELAQAVDWINASGGVAVIAHPLRYKITASWLKRFFKAFREAGGQGIEVVCRRSNTDEIHLIGNYARQYEFYGSVGSDFHTPGNPWVELGRLAPLPKGVRPVGELFG